MKVPFLFWLDSATRRPFLFTMCPSPPSPLPHVTIAISGTTGLNPHYFVWTHWNKFLNADSKNAALKKKKKKNLKSLDFVNTVPWILTLSQCSQHQQCKG